MNILLIGNGFDLSHGLPTSYGDFLDYVMSPNNPKSKEMRENIWIDGFQNSRTSLGGNWIDLEAEISLIIQTLDLWYKNSTEAAKSNLPAEYKLLFKEITSMGYAKPIKNVAAILVNELKQFIDYLDEYLEAVTRLKPELFSPDIKDLEIQKVLSFNYTDTFQKIYDKEEKAEYDYIHGKMGQSPNNMVLGINEYLLDESKNIELDFVQFKKYFQRINKKTGCIYKCWLDELYDSLENGRGVSECLEAPSSTLPTLNIYVYGHSLDLSDKDILEELLMYENSYTTIFYHNDEAYTDQVINLIKVIGQDNLTKFVHGAHPKIKFQRQQEMISGKKDTLS